MPACHTSQTLYALFLKLPNKVNNVPQRLTTTVCFIQKESSGGRQILKNM